MREPKSLNYDDVDAQVCRRCGVRGEGQHGTPGDRSQKRAVGSDSTDCFRNGCSR